MADTGALPLVIPMFMETRIGAGRSEHDDIEVEYSIEQRASAFSWDLYNPMVVSVGEVAVPRAGLIGQGRAGGAYVVHGASGGHVAPLEIAALVADALAKQLEGIEDRIVERVKRELEEQGDIASVDPETVKDAVRAYFAANDGKEFDADEVASALGFPIWPVIDAIDALEAEGSVALAG